MMAVRNLVGVDRADNRDWPGEATKQTVSPANEGHRQHLKSEEITMQGTLTTPRFSRLAAIVRRAAMPMLVLTVAACDDNPTGPVQAQEGAAFGKVIITSYQGHLLFTSGSPDSYVNMLNPQTNNVFKVAIGSTGAWSPDYSRISYSKGLLEGLWIMDANGANEKQLVLLPTVMGSAFSPDGDYIAFVAGVGMNLQVHKIELATGNVTQLTNLTGVGTRVSWSQDGKRILFDMGNASGRDLFTIEPDGSNQTQVSQCKGFCNDGHYSPDGKAIAFIHNSQVARMTAAGANVKMLTSASDPQPHWPSWSPSGKQIAYERQSGQQHDIWAVTVANGVTASLITNRLDDTTPNWSR